LRHSRYILTLLTAPPDTLFTTELLLHCFCELDVWTVCSCAVMHKIMKRRLLDAIQVLSHVVCATSIPITWCVGWW